MKGILLGRAVYRRAELPTEEEIHPPPALLQIVEAAAREAGVGIIGMLCCANNLGGSTAAIAVSESQIVVYTARPPSGPQAVIDVFFCGQFNPLATADNIVHRLSAIRWQAPNSSKWLINRLDDSELRPRPRLAAVDLYGCDPQLLNNRQRVENLMRQAAKNANLEVSGDTFYEFHPHGITGIIIGPAFTMSVHTWPEYGTACVDINTCDYRIFRWLLQTIKKDLGVTADHVHNRTELDDQGLVLRGVHQHLMTGDSTPALELAAST